MFFLFNQTSLFQTVSLIEKLGGIVYEESQCYRFLDLAAAVVEEYCIILLSCGGTVYLVFYDS